MTRIIFLIILLGISALLVTAQTHSNLNMGYDYATLEILEKNLRPDTDGPFSGYDFGESIKGTVGSVDIQLHKTVININKIKWDGTKNFAAKNGFPAFILKDLEITVQFGAEVKFGSVHEKSEKNILNATLDFEVIYGYAKASPEVTYTYLAEVNTPVKSSVVDLKGKLAKIKPELEKALGTTIQGAALQLLRQEISKANETLIEETSKPYIDKDLYGIEFRFSLIDLPKLVRHHDYNNNPIQAFEYAIALFKDDKRYVPFNDTHTLPPAVKNFAPFQMIIGDELFQMSYWADYEVSYAFDYDVRYARKGFIKYYTHEVVNIFPDIVKEFGEKKGLYIRASPWGKNPIGKIENGKEVNSLPIKLEYWVDTESKKYPAAGRAERLLCL